jgi:hypothetical protein
VAKKTKRLIYRVEWNKKSNGWVLTYPNKFQKYCWPVKADAVAEGRECARTAHEANGDLTQLVVHKKDGKIQFENTYGKDPSKYPG